jgi:hypothetical protein
VSISSASQTNLTASLANNNDQFTVQVGSGPVNTFTIATGETLAQLEAQLNTISGLSATSVADPTILGNVFVQLQTTNGQDFTIMGISGHSAATKIFGIGAPGTGTHQTIDVTIQGVDDFLAPASPLLVPGLHVFGDVMPTS